MGCDTFTKTEYPPHVNRFRTLIAAMLSSQTKDEVNAGAMARLSEHGMCCRFILPSLFKRSSCLRSDRRINAANLAHKVGRIDLSCQLFVRRLNILVLSSICV